MRSHTYIDTSDTLKQHTCQLPVISSFAVEA